MRPGSRTLAAFFLATFALSTPFYVWGVVAPARGLPFGLPATAIMIVVPATVASALVLRHEGGAALAAMWRRLFDIGGIRNIAWLAAAIAIMPAASIAAYLLMTATGAPLPIGVQIPFSQAPMMLGVYLFGAAFEEIGWTAFATGPMQQSLGIWRAALLIGLFWAAWHVVPWWLGQGHSLRWVIGQSVATVLMRAIMGWLYARCGRSLSLAVIFHAMINVCYSLFPNQGSHYDPWMLSVSLGAILIMIIAVVPRI